MKKNHFILIIEVNIFQIADFMKEMDCPWNIDTNWWVILCSGTNRTWDMARQVQGLVQGKMGKSESENVKSRASDVRNGQACNIIYDVKLKWQHHPGVNNMPFTISALTPRSSCNCTIKALVWYTVCLQMGIEQIPLREKELKIGFQAGKWVYMFMEQFKVCPMIQEQFFGAKW